MLGLELPHAIRVENMVEGNTKKLLTPITKVTLAAGGENIH